jgi:hypothetical protein
MENRKTLLGITSDLLFVLESGPEPNQKGDPAYGSNCERGGETSVIRNRKRKAAQALLSIQNRKKHQNSRQNLDLAQALLSKAMLTTSAGHKQDGSGRSQREPDRKLNGGMACAE